MSQNSTRKLGSRIAVVLFAIVLPLATIGAWAITTVTNTDRWVATLHPLATNTTITNYLADQASIAIVQQVGVEQRIKTAIPQAGFLAGTITTEVQKTITKALSQAMASPEFSTFWDKANRVTHTIAINYLSGKSGQRVGQAHDLVVDVTPAIISAIDQLSSRGITFLLPLKKAILDNKVAVLHILSQKELAKVQRYYKTAIDLRWVLLLAALVLAVLTVVLARPFRAGFRRLGIGLAISAAVTFCLLKIGINLMAPLAPTPPDVAKAILQTMTVFLTDELFALTLIGVAIVAIAWFTGRGTRAVESRKWIALNSKAVGSAIGRRSHELRDGELSTWMEGHQRQLRVALTVANVAIGLFVLIAVFTLISSILGLILLVVLSAAWYWIQKRLSASLSSSTPSLEAGDEPANDVAVSITSGDASDATTPK